MRGFGGNSPLRRCQSALMVDMARRSLQPCRKRRRPHTLALKTWPFQLPETPALPTADLKNTLTTCLWLDKEAEEALQFCTSPLPNSCMGAVQRHAEDSPFGTKKGDVMAARATRMGQDFMAINGGKMFPQTEAVSFQIHCDTQEEVDHDGDSLTAGGGKTSQCGWLKDRFGVSWQVIPAILEQVMAGGDNAARERGTAAFMRMQKLDVAALKAAAKG
jgi:predicted 3-demethylubiquinone-9 3-methyltransferase (glyoxalase superfamily)